jgi:hypothetical protein
MTKACRVDGERGNREVPPTERAGALRRRQRAGRQWGNQAFPHASKPEAREAA